MFAKIRRLVRWSARPRRTSSDRVRTTAGHGTVVQATVAAWVLAATALVGGCRGDDAEPSSLAPVTTTTSRSVSPSQSASALPTPPAEARRKTSEGAAAFVRFYIGLINEAYRSGASDPLRRYAAPSCDSCTSIASAVDDIYKQGGHAEGGELSIRSIESSVIDKDVQPTVVANTSTDAFTRFDASGERTHHNPGERRTLLFDLDWTDSGWHVIGIRSEKGDSA